MSKDVKKYKEIVKTIYYKRWFGNLSQDEEGEVAEILDDIWRKISKEEQQEIESFIGKRYFLRKFCCQPINFSQNYPYFFTMSFFIFYLFIVFIKLLGNQ